MCNVVSGSEEERTWKERKEERTKRELWKEMTVIRITEGEQAELVKSRDAEEANRNYQLKIISSYDEN